MTSRHRLKPQLVNLEERPKSATGVGSEPVGGRVNWPLPAQAAARLAVTNAGIVPGSGVQQAVRCAGQAGRGMPTRCDAEPGRRDELPGEVGCVGVRHRW